MANEPIDIFSPTEPGGQPLPPPPAPTSGQIPPTQGMGQPPVTPLAPAQTTAQQQALSAVEEQELFGQDKMSGKQLAIIIIVGVIVLSALGGGGYFVYQGLTTADSTQIGNQNINASTNTNAGVNRNQNTNVVIPPVNTNRPVNTNTQVNTNTTVNTNTSINTNGSADPDVDGLTNDQEATYGTNPNNPDSDGDGFLDGDEVQNGYNPLGPGKL